MYWIEKFDKENPDHKFLGICQGSGPQHGRPKEKACHSQFVVEEEVASKKYGYCSGHLHERLSKDEDLRVALMMQLLLKSL